MKTYRVWVQGGCETIQAESMSYENGQIVFETDGKEVAVFSQDRVSGVVTVQREKAEREIRERSGPRALHVDETKLP